jgi:hypothetical protein
MEEKERGRGVGGTKYLKGSKLGIEKDREKDRIHIFTAKENEKKV